MSAPATLHGRVLLMSGLVFPSGRRLADHPELVAEIEAEAAAVERARTAEAARMLRILIPGLDALLVLDAASIGRILAGRPDVWDVVRAYLRHPRDTGG